MPDEQVQQEVPQGFCRGCDRRFNSRNAAPVPILPHLTVCADCAKALPKPGPGWREWYIRRYGRDPDTAAKQART